MHYDVSDRVKSGGQDSRGYIFVVGHMRSFSSLLCHILGSHDEISGYAETHQSYYGRVDLDNLTRQVQEALDAPKHGRYVLDKILHNKEYIAPSVLAMPDLKVVLLVRRPEDTLPSLVNLAHAVGATSDVDPVKALDYYVARLRQIEAYGAQLGRNALFVESERLIDDTDTVLSGLSRWLKLGHPVSSSYKTFKFTGMKGGYGDPGPDIMTGKVVRDAEERHRTYVPVVIPEDLRRRAEEAYAACREALASCDDGR